MPGRIIREGLLDSDALGEVSIEAECLFVRLMLLADDFGRYDGRVGVICRRAFINRPTLDGQMTDRCLTELCGVGLVEKYEVGGRPYIQIPKFRQRMRIMRSRYPRPDGQFDTKQALNDQDVGQPSDTWQTDVGQVSDGCQASVGVKRREEKKNLERESLEREVQTTHVPKKERGEARQVARRVLEFLNSKTGSGFEAVPANLDLIAARVREGSSEEDCRQVIAAKCREWVGTERQVYLRPKTLFAASNFANYKGQLGKVEGGGA